MLFLREKTSIKERKNIIKTALTLVLVLVSVFCVFSGCGVKDNGENITETGENTGDKPNYTVVAPITDGGSFDGGNYR